VSLRLQRESLAERVGFERLAVLQTKEVPLESIAASDENLNFRAPLAHYLAQVPYFPATFSRDLHVSMDF
jgi:hypothetical protein